MGISNYAMLVEFKMSVWTANKRDKEAERSVAAMNSSAEDAAKVHKNLLAGTHQRKAISDFAAQTRKFYAENTIPWNDRGQRIIPTSKFLEFKRELDSRMQEYELMCEEFFLEYPSIRARAADYHTALGRMYDPSDYPETSEVREKFGCSLVFSPIPEAGDFRLDVAEEELAEVRSGYEKDFNNRLATAMRTPWERLHKQVTSMVEKLSKDDARYHDTFIDNARAMCSMLKDLNITQDPELDKARKSLEDTIVGANVDTLKEDAVARTEMKDKLDTILKSFDW